MHKCRRTDADGWTARAGRNVTNWVQYVSRTMDGRRAGGPLPGPGLAGSTPLLAKYVSTLAVAVFKCYG